MHCARNGEHVYIDGRLDEPQEIIRRAEDTIQRYKKLFPEGLFLKGFDKTWEDQKPQILDYVFEIDGLKYNLIYYQS